MPPSFASVASLLIAGLLLAPACNRAPEEPAPAASTRPQDVVIASASAPPTKPPPKPKYDGRCVQETSDTPPPPVPPGPAPGCPRDPDPPLRLATARVAFPEATKGPASVDAEIVHEGPESQRGLMYRTAMPEDHGMLFALGPPKINYFWMHNTCIPLDMLFLDDDGLIVGILENVPTLDDDSRSVRCPSTHVLETNAGWSRRHGVRAGQHAVLPK